MYISLLKKFIDSVEGKAVPDLLDGSAALEELVVALKIRDQFESLHN